MAKREHGWRKMRVLTSHPYGPGSIPEPVVTCEFSLLLVLVLALRIFLQVLRFSSLYKNHFSKFQLDLKTVDKNRHSGMSITKFTYHKRQRLVAWVHYEEGGLQSGGLADKEDTASTPARVTSFARVSPLMIVSL